MRLKSLTLKGFKSFSEKKDIIFNDKIVAVVGPNGSGKSNITESFRFVLGEQSMKILRSKKGENLIYHGHKNLSSHNNASVKIVFNNNDNLFLQFLLILLVYYLIYIRFLHSYTQFALTQVHQKKL